jgi:glutamate-5-semialdehyde dehydrogenase
MAAAAVDAALTAFAVLAGVSDAAVSAFFAAFAAHLADDRIWERVAAANAADVARARAAGRSTTRLEASAAMRADMIAGLEAWAEAPPGRGRIVERIDHDGWVVEQVAAPLGVVGFVFEGRPNVFADAAGVIRGGNTAVFRIGSDALGTARAIAGLALAPALAEAGLPASAAVLLDSAERAAGWALFSDPRLALAVVRGSGEATAQLGAVARQSGTPASLHGTGGAWLIADGSADTARFAAAVTASLDRKACNTLNVCCIVRGRARELVPTLIDALVRAGEGRGHGARLHVTAAALPFIADKWRAARVTVRGREGDCEEAFVTSLAEADLGREWEWEETPEIALAVTEDLDHAVTLFNRLSPRFIASLIAADEAVQARFYAGVEAAFIGDGFTRWVDGQYALRRPELGLSNWRDRRLLARGAILSGDGVYTVRTRMRQLDPGLSR